LTDSSPRVALVTGSTRVIGHAVARHLLRSGWVVGINGRDREAVRAAAQALGCRAHPVDFDIRDPATTEESVLAFAKAHGAPNAIGHCAGIMKDAPLGRISTAFLREAPESNVVGTINLSQPVLRGMSRGRAGSAVLFGSIVGADGSPGQGVYSASKSAISGIVKGAAPEVAGRGVRVNGIAPGSIRTDLLAGLSAEKLRSLELSVPLGRLGAPDDVAGLAVFLVSDKPRYITGQVIRVDGGLSR